MVPRRACGPASSPCQCRRCSRRRPRGDRRRRRRRAVVVSAEYAGKLPAIVAAAPACEHAVVVDGSTGDDLGIGRAPLDRLRRPRAVVGRRHDRRLSGVLAVQLRHDRGAEGRDAPARQPRRQRPTRTPPTCSGSTADDRFLSVAKLFFAYGLGNSLTFPFVGRRDRRSSSPPADAGRDRRARPSRAADAVLRQPRLRRRRARHRHAGRGLRQRPRDGHRRRVAARRPAAALQRAVRAPGARRHRVDRGAAHLPVEHARRPAPGDQRHAGAGLRGVPARRRRGRGRRARHPRLPPRARAVDRHRLLAARRTRRPRRSCPTGGCAPATSTPARPTATGRSSAATTT